MQTPDKYAQILPSSKHKYDTSVPAFVRVQQIFRTYLKTLAQIHPLRRTSVPFDSLTRLRQAAANSNQRRHELSGPI